MHRGTAGRWRIAFALAALFVHPPAGVAAEPTGFDLAKGMKLVLRFTYAPSRTADEAYVVVKDFAATEKGLTAVQIEYAVPRFQAAAPSPPRETYLPGPPVRLTYAGIERRSARAAVDALATSDLFYFPGLWARDPAAAEASSLLWLSTKTYSDLMTKKRVVVKLPPAVAGGEKAVESEMHRDSMSGSFTLRLNGELVMMPVVRAHDAHQNFYLVLQNPRNPIVLSVRYGLVSGRRTLFSGGGCDVVSVTIP